MVQQLTTKTGKQIVDSVDKICDYVDAGDSPNTAAIKVARDNGMTPARIELVCRSYNGGVVNATRRESDTFSEKFAAVAKADPAVVIEAVFPKTAKVAADNVVADRYLPKKPTLAKAASETTEVSYKIARCDCGCGRKEGECVENKMSSYGKARRKMAKIEALRVDARQYESIAAAKVAMVIDAFRDTYGNQYEVLPWLNKVAQEYFGEVGGKLIDRIALKKMSKYQFEKYASNKSADLVTFLGRGFVEPRSRQNPVLVAVKTAIEALQVAAKASAELPMKVIELRREIQKIDQRFAHTKRAILLPPGMTPEEADDYSWKKRSSILAGMMGAAGMGMMGGGNKGGTGGGDSSSLIKARLKLNDPQHETELKRIQAESLLNQLINSDEVISSYQPEEVADAFEEIEQSAPGMVSNMSLLRSNLRRQLAGNMTPFESKDMVQTSQDITNRPAEDLKQLTSTGIK